MDRVRQLRANPTLAETTIWQRLRNKQSGGCRFRRQFPLGPYVVDFVCLGHRLIVEIDGGQHSAEVDRTRTEWLENQDFKILRFWNHDVLTNTDGVIATIASHIAPPPLAGGGREEG